ncbi:citrulline utilization hydrolase CtlX [Hymenobacter cellulosilyticus]|uniref:Arginine deiminase-related protein n=1 Tax=Hymenobacter cellulosilyticus TaxID=2932248 RepID=A0A8T9Q4V3_9BACT|nr:arginine deiminase-related protein [Hymenobacter cellulosilyticus]UOQ70123.1 arginine deiminase-related protein [Hymenobacter cellulosilyticus]
MQSASTVLLVRPASFAFNAETAQSNHFQHALTGLSAKQVQQQAYAEFDNAVATLRERGVRVLVEEDTPAPAKPDAVFPNNWGTFHPDGRVLLYPMCAPNRRSERRPDILERLGQQFVLTEVVDLSAHEQRGRFLEGTGSIIFDHVHRRAYACLSARTDAALFEEVAARLSYKPVPFHAYDAQDQSIYHTNVMLCVGAGFAVICLESITDAADQTRVVESLTSTGHEIVAISLGQVTQFAGNMLTVQPATGPELLVMSQSAYDALTVEQRGRLSQYCELLPLPIPTIETIGAAAPAACWPKSFCRRFPSPLSAKPASPGLLAHPRKPGPDTPARRRSRRLEWRLAPPCRGAGWGLPNRPSTLKRPSGRRAGEKTWSAVRGGRSRRGAGQ